ncbi:MAG TPA: GNAT family N-acetyltransferase [Beutenbergiaceae bacterium]|nr:GNAT family N-acetyltransferase [Beutenbergiaceae bacterium]
MSLRIDRVSGVQGLARAHALRWEVFVTEQGVLAAEELDGRDELPGTVHLVAVDSTGQDVGTARLLADPDRPGVVHVTRVAVSSTARGRGVGRALMADAERIALAEYATGTPPSVRVELSAQESAIAFYAALGYDIGVERYLDARIWHRDAVRTLPVAAAAAEPGGPPARP